MKQFDLGFETDRLRLKPTNKEDAAFIYQLMNTPKWIQYIGDRDIKTIHDAEIYILEKMRPQQERLGFSNYTVIRKIDGTKLGTCGLYDREGLAGIDIGFAFLPQFEKMGFAFEAAQRMIKAAFEDFGIQGLRAITSKENVSSQKLLQKLGLKKIGTTKLLNDKEELLLYELKNNLASII